MGRREDYVEGPLAKESAIAKYRLLIIEDDKNIVDLVLRIAVQVGFDVRSTCDITEIPSLYDEFLPHVIVLDILMPDMDGFEVLNFLYKRHSKSRIAILSGHGDYRGMAARMAKGLNLAIVLTIRKPFRISEFREALERIKLSLFGPDKQPVSGGRLTAKI